MRTTTAFLSGMATMGILAGGVAVGAGLVTNSDTETPDASGSTSPSATTSDAAGTEATASPSPATERTDSPTAVQPQQSRVGGSSVRDGTYDGAVVQTRYGPMEVEVVISGGKIVSATTVQQPGSDPTSQQINRQVIPILIKATVDYQTVTFGNVSRATITSMAYKQSAQAALDEAGFTG